MGVKPAHGEERADYPRALRELLLISYYFPPSGGPGVQRVLKFTRYLPRYGYRPVVLTVPENASFPQRDPSLAAEIPDEAVVCRSPLLEFYRLYRAAAGRDERSPANLVTSSAGDGSVRERVLLRLRASLFIPDGRVGWLPGGTRAGLALCRRRPIEALFASGPPFTTHWIGARIARRTGLPLVLDFRDPWTHAPFYPDRPAWARRLDERLERGCLRQASLVITVNRRIREDFLARYPEIPPERIRVITNGFDAADFEGLERSAGGPWTLTHTGTLPAGGFPSGLAPALTRLLDEEPGADLRIRLLGTVPPEVRSLLERPPLDRVLSFEGYVSHRKSVQALVDSHLLLLVIEDGREAAGMLTGKLFEYLGSGTPVLALAPEGEAAEIIRRTGAGRVVRGSDSDAILAALREARAAFREGRPAFSGTPGPPRPEGSPPDARSEEISAYSRERLTADLARAIEAMLLSRRVRGA